jgi:enoyl-CoA hydratase/carnithine racemase
VLSEADDIARISFNLPRQRNPQRPATWTALASAINDLPATVRVVILQGEGPSFSAGLDRALFGAVPGGLEELARLPAAAAQDRIASFQRGIAALARPSFVSIALVQGHAIGAGLQVALACDFRVAADDAQLRMAEVGLGLVPDLGGTKRLVELVGYSRAAAICLSGSTVSAQAALRMGLVNEVVPVDDLEAAGQRWADQLTALPHTAVTETKALLLTAAHNLQGEQERLEAAAQHRQLRLLAGIETEDGPS